MGQIIEESSLITTNYETGQQVEKTESKVIRFEKTPDFVMAFTKSLSIMKDLTKGQMVLMFGLLKIVNQENEIILNKTIKERIKKEFEINSINSIDVNLNGLVKADMLYRRGRGVYLLNTEVFGKGKWTDIKKLRTITEYDFERETITTANEADYLTEAEKLTLQIKALEEEKEKILNQEKKKNVETRFQELKFQEIDNNSELSLKEKEKKKIQNIIYEDNIKLTDKAEILAHIDRENSLKANGFMGEPKPLSLFEEDVTED